MLSLLGDQGLDTEHGGVSADDVQWVSGPLDMLGVLVRGVVLWGRVWGISARELMPADITDAARSPRRVEVRCAKPGWAWRKLLRVELR